MRKFKKVEKKKIVGENIIITDAEKILSVRFDKNSNFVEILFTSGMVTNQYFSDTEEAREAFEQIKTTLEKL